jgi:fructose-1-phosphate kinase PfkB-like protein
LGHEVHVRGVFGARIGNWLVDECRKESVTVHPIECSDDNRINLTLLSGSEEYVISDRHQQINELEVSELFNTFRLLSSSFPYIVFAGSVPSGVDAEHYSALAHIANEANARVVLDAKPQFLRAALPSAWLVKINQFEAKGLDLNALSLNAGITCQQRGAYFKPYGGCWLKVDVPEVKKRNSVGAGDVFLSYLLDGYWRWKSWDEALKWASAAASSSVTTEPIGEVDQLVFDYLRKSVRLKEVDFNGQGED